MYGGTFPIYSQPKLGSGLSPRVRGNPIQPHFPVLALGSIPACTGEPTLWRGCVFPNPVYPRVYGGTRSFLPAVTFFLGLSPRVRGNLQEAVRLRGRQRSIPACTGEPGADGKAIRAIQVYPRVYGGTGRAQQDRDFGLGLSPRVRGNRRLERGRGVRSRSIPACTGEPSPMQSHPGAAGVYPRVYGGTGQWTRLRKEENGLSPRVRGNRGLGLESLNSLRSIPACTGEPDHRANRACIRKVYPRVYGGTRIRQWSYAPLSGLSPRVRGNHQSNIDLITQVRSIPACTGEPETGLVIWMPRAVYPRVYGGTPWTHNRIWDFYGLSPRVRGNPTSAGDGLGTYGSIPACTGEPGQRSPRSPIRWVYPRVYGGTMTEQSQYKTVVGLSPRVRGNPPPQS